VIPAAFPSLLSLAARYRSASLSFSAEVAWEDFSEWPSPDTQSEPSLTISGVPIDLLNMPPPRAAPAPHDRWVPRLGVEYRALSGVPITLSARAGYAFERSPLPPQRTTRWLDADRHTLTAGVGFEHDLGADTALGADLFAALTLLPERSAVRSSALGGPAAASGSMFSTGVGISFNF
jgi:long-subunit fatty acid transport protein